MLIILHLAIYFLVHILTKHHAKALRYYGGLNTNGTFPTNLSFSTISKLHLHFLCLIKLDKHKFDAYHII